MTIHASTFRKLAFSTFLVSVSLNAAFAQDTTAVADRLKASLAGQSVDISWTGVSGDASSMVLEGVTVKPVGEKESLPIGDITLDGVAEADGGITIQTATTKPFTRTEEGVELAVSPVIFHDLTIPPAGATGPTGSLMLYKSVELATFTASMAGKTAFALNNLTFNITPPAEGKALEFSGNAEKFNADLTLIDDPKTKEVIDTLGYQTINGSFKTTGSWQPTDGRMALSQYDITVDNAGTLGVTFDVGGYTLDFIKSLQDMQKKMAEQPADGDKSAQGMAMLGLMQQLTFNSTSIRFDDDSLTNKVLDYVGKQQGMSGKDIANQAKAIIPFGMAQLQNPELTAQVSAAVGKFLDDPQSLEILAQPPSAVPFALIMAGAMSNPYDLTKTLGVTVKANED